MKDLNCFFKFKKFLKNMHVLHRISWKAIQPSALVVKWRSYKKTKNSWDWPLARFNNFWLLCMLMPYQSAVPYYQSVQISFREWISAQIILLCTSKRKNYYSPNKTWSPIPSSIYKCSYQLLNTQNQRCKVKHKGKNRNQIWELRKVGFLERPLMIPSNAFYLFLLILSS